MSSWHDNHLNKRIPINSTSSVPPQKASINATINSMSPAAVYQYHRNNITYKSTTERSFFNRLTESGIKLNDSQIEAVRAPIAPNCVLAPAGAGKTTTILARIAYLINVAEALPKEILAVTFSKKAAGEMKDRLNTFPGISRDMSNRITIMTMHGLFYSILKKIGHQVNIIPEGRKRAVITKLLKDCGMRGQVSYNDAALAISYWKNNLMSPSSVNKEEPNGKLLGVFKGYEDFKNVQGLMDFDDLIVKCYSAFKQSKVRNWSGKLFKHVLIDEMQDTNKGQWEIMRAIAQPENSLFVVGDEDQSIYGFRGAEPKILLSFPNLYKNANIYQLNVNYRSCPEIIGFSSKVIASNKQRFDKKVYAAGVVKGTKPKFIEVRDEETEALYLAGRIQALVADNSHSFNDFAILFRVNSYVRSTIEALIDQKVPFVIDQEGEGFYEKTIVKGLLANLSLALDPKDSTAFSYAAPSFYLKKEWEQRIVSAVRYGKASDLFEALKGLQNLPDFQRKNISDKIALMKKIKHQGPQAALRLLRTQGGYDSFILKGSNIYENQDNVILEDLEELQSSAKKFSTIDSFLQHIEKIRQIQQEQRKSADNPKVDAVRLLSIHKSKGMEFGYVFIIGALEGVLPHANCSGTDDIEEERRLMYVASSRAQHTLEITAPKIRWGKAIKVSRFLTELTD